MKFSVTSCIAILASVAYSQGATSTTTATGSTGNATPTTSGAGTTHTVAVGGTGNRFEPQNTNVEVGDVVIFQFRTNTHNILQSDTQGGCTKSTNPAAKQFPASGLAAQGQTWTYTVAPLTPTAKGIWFYCAPHCKGGMTAGLLLGNATARSADGTNGGDGTAGGAAPTSSADLAMAPKAVALGVVAFAAVYFTA